MEISCEENIYVEDDPAVLAAQKAFGAKYLYSWQRLVISNIMDSLKGEVEEEGDVFCRGRQIVLLPTGAGKSMCFLVPSILLPGPTLIIYPLLALMNDQQRRMESGSIKCVIFKGGQSDEEREENFRLLELKETDENYENRARVIIANPEVLQSKKILSRLSKCGISHIAIDEAHCVCEWGDSFRPSYLTLGEIIKTLGVKIVTAFTATASPIVLSRIAQVLFDTDNGGDVHIVRSAGDRANIHYEVRYFYAKEMAVLKACQTEEKPLIVFCGTRKRTEDIAELLTAYFGHNRVRFYHAGLEKEEKKDCEKWFMDSKDGILAATCAFGMGVDKSDIKTVVHLDAPEHLENYVQEAGRAGRDGSNVKAILIWNHADQVSFRHAKENSREKMPSLFANAASCRRQFILDYLGAEKTTCSGCDVCDAERKGEKLSYESEDAEIAVKFVKRNRRNFTKDEIVEKLLEIFNEKDLPVFGEMVWTAKDIQEILAQLISQRKIQICKGLWKGKVDIAAVNLLLKILPPKIIHRLHRCRRLLRHFQERLLEQVQALAGKFSGLLAFLYNLPQKMRKKAPAQQ